MSDLHFRFIIPDTTGHSLEAFRQGTLDSYAELYCHGEFCWALQSYHVLKHHDLSVDLAFDPDPDAINLAHGNLLRELKKRADCFCVSLQADFPQYPLAQYHIVQNPDQEGPNASFLPLWPQIGQEARDGARSEIETVAYQGEIHFTDLDQEQLNTDLEAHGMTFKILDASNWHDLRNVDLLVGIRSFGKKEYKRKPPSKLINAWHAGIPFIGGWDSAFSQIGIPGKEYIRVSGYDELLDSILRLKNEPALYEKFVESGQLKAPQYTFDAMAELWISLLTERIIEAYSSWNKQTGKRVTYQLKHFKYAISKGLRQFIQKLYAVPFIKRMRDLYYDPVK